MAGCTKDAFLAAERYQESGGNYQIVNPNSGALGAWQVMPDNLPGWLAQAGQPPMSPAQFLRDPGAQNAVAYTILGGYYDTYGPQGAAAMWYSGQPDAAATFGDPPVDEYVTDVMTMCFQGIGGSTINYGTAPGGPDFTLPPPSPDDWSPTIRGTAAVLKTAGAQLHADAAAINDLR
jgi:hypothetical protein